MSSKIQVRILGSINILKLLMYSKNIAVRSYLTKPNNHILLYFNKKNNKMIKKLINTCNKTNNKHIW